ncbi:MULTISPECIES: heme biosynthesis HemY N-terminal domain-containing protein [unclassified Colwellia]|jgi:HemY protein|uniref:heme biosynthesis HemY N-terminal domain-containing protein n=1 Tax=unclassified Colwellia TaxID=196834 RepID=UPI0015F6A44F|nr:MULTISPECIES: heme biosynthesis HemY N-terminal domain-containing protein [unclassified Colwellia]MBA6253607.1 heme biosynthesis protein HemY [Colwellia sp. MB3u-55]MBA6397439.1 heme biosynthesis protein HemY [Colwellia sp. BRX10-4]
MKKLILWILIFFAAVAISPLLINEKGYILIAMGDLTIESTVVMACIMLTLLFIALGLSMTLVRGSLRLGFGSWNKIAFANRRRGLRDFNRGIAAFILEDNQQAEHLFAKAAEPSKFTHTSYLLAAAASSKQSLRSNTNHYLALLAQEDNGVKGSGLESILVTIKLLISQEDFPQARSIIDKHHKQIGHDARLLSLEIILSLQEKRFDYVIEQLVSARKQKAITNEKIALWEASAFYGAFNETIRKENNDSLAQRWHKLTRKLKHNEVILWAYCRVLAEHKITEPLNKILLPVIKKGADDTFLKNIRQLPILATDELIGAVQKQLHNDPHSGKWLSCLANLAAKSQQLPMAEKAFNSLINLADTQYDVIDLLSFSQVLEQQGEYKKANQVLNKALGQIDNFKNNTLAINNGNEQK